MPNENPFIVVTGSARAGTTAVARGLAKHEGAHYQQYRDMPFPILSGIIPSWLKTLTNLGIKSKLRLHNDGLSNTSSDLEAFEEILLNFLASDKTIDDSRFRECYRHFRDLITDNSGFYLAKNNYFVVHYGRLKSEMGLRIVIIFRNFVEHAKSIRRVHKEILEAQSNDSFITEYMDGLCHYEFGAHRKMLHFSGTNANLGCLGSSGDSLDSEISMLKDYYEYWLRTSDPKICFIDADVYRGIPDKIEAGIFKWSKDDLSSHVELTGHTTTMNQAQNFEEVYLQLRERFLVFHEKYVAQ